MIALARAQRASIWVDAHTRACGTYLICPPLRGTAAGSGVARSRGWEGGLPTRAIHSRQRAGARRASVAGESTTLRSPVASGSGACLVCGGRLCRDWRCVECDWLRLPASDHGADYYGGGDVGYGLLAWYFHSSSCCCFWLCVRALLLVCACGVLGALQVLQALQVAGARSYARTSSRQSPGYSWRSTQTRGPKDASKGSILSALPRPCGRCPGSSHFSGGCRRPRKPPRVRADMPCVRV
ncbi:hypothetical protein C8Q80DRAFT_737871 [Daedaleopsis nitida]|nr:hypothetical protein C8Q80DRAFT_737871 [Daedaleopsis nitida]